MSDADRYSVFGLRVRSDIPLPELQRANGRSETDVEVRRGSVGGGGSRSPGLHEVEGGTLLIVEDVGRYLVTGGREIIVDAESGVPAKNVRLYLLGSAFGLLLHQRGLFPLHANAIGFGSSVVTFTGASGAGKSTLAAWFHDSGHKVIADDVCVLRFEDEDRLVAYPGIPRLRLWRDVLERSGRFASDFSRSYAGDDSFDKFDVPIAAPVDDPVAVAAICLLAWGEEVRLDEISGVDAAEVVMANTYRGWVLQETAAVRSHWETAVRITARVPILRFSRPRGDVDRSCERLRELLGRY